jgi:hypothetical protein
MFLRQRNPKQRKLLLPLPHCWHLPFLLPHLRLICSFVCWSLSRATKIPPCAKCLELGAGVHHLGRGDVHWHRSQGGLAPPGRAPRQGRRSLRGVCAQGHQRRRVCCALVAIRSTPSSTSPTCSSRRRPVRSARRAGSATVSRRLSSRRNRRRRPRRRRRRQLRRRCRRSVRRQWPAAKSCRRG